MFIICLFHASVPVQSSTEYGEELNNKFEMVHCILF